MANLRAPGIQPRSGLDQYSLEAWKTPLLGKEEEQEPAIRWRDQRDSASVDLVIASHSLLIETLIHCFFDSSTRIHNEWCNGFK